jgi:hypothetical protein
LFTTLFLNQGDASHYPAVVTQTTPQGQAEQKGVLVGMHVHTINGVSCRDQKLAFVMNKVKQAKQHVRVGFKFSYLVEETETIRKPPMAPFNLEFSKGQVVVVSVKKKDNNPHYHAQMKPRHVMRSINGHGIDQ